MVTLVVITGTLFESATAFLMGDMANQSFHYFRLWRIYYILYYNSQNSAVSPTKKPMLDYDVKPFTCTTVHLYMCTVRTPPGTGRRGTS